MSFLLGGINAWTTTRVLSRQTVYQASPLDAGFLAGLYRDVLGKESSRRNENARYLSKRPNRARFVSKTLARCSLGLKYMPSYQDF